MNTLMVVISGVWIAMMPKVKWYWSGFKKLNIAYHCIGVYTSLLGLLHWLGVGINEGLWILALTASILLVIATIILKLKSEKNVMDIIMIVASVLLLIGATSIVIIELEELTSSFMIIMATLLLLSFSFNDIFKNHRKI